MKSSGAPLTQPSFGSVKTASNESSTPPSQRLTRVTSFGNYDLLEEIGQGGMGVVYRAFDRRQGCIVALKTLRNQVEDNSVLAQRFRREAEILSQLTHPHIVPVHEVGQTDGRFFIAMPFISGGSLDRYRNRFLLDHPSAVAMAEKIAQALHHAHELGILHRDLKPANVLLDERGEPLVSDFGLARLDDAGPELTRAGSLVGTPAYMAPEQAGGGSDKIGPATDVWAIGVLLYELVIGCRPFVGDNYRQVLRTVLFETPISPRLLRPNVDPSLEAVILKCLEKDPDHRYQTAAELGADLRRCLKGQPVQGVLAEPASKGKQLPTRYAGLVAAFGAAVIAVVAWSATGRQTDASENWRSAPGRFQTLSDRIGKGQPVELLGQHQLPSWYHWRMGKTSYVDSDPFTIETMPPSMLDLAATVPVDGYRLFAQVKAISLGLGDAGIYFECVQRETEEGTEHWFYALTLSQNAYANRVALQLFRCREQDGYHKSIFDKVHIIEWELTSTPSPDPEWVPLAVEVEPTKIRVYMQGKWVGEIATMDIEPLRRVLLDMPSRLHTAPADLSPRGSVGLLVKGGRGAFRNVIIQPLNSSTVVFP